MKKEQLQAVGVVLGAAIAAHVYFVFMLSIQRGGLVRWQEVVEGLLTGAAVLGVWKLARTRGAATVGLGVALVIVLLGTTGAVEPALAFAQAPLGWAVTLALVARLVAPGATAADERSPERTSF